MEKKMYIITNTSTGNIEYYNATSEQARQRKKDFVNSDHPHCGYTIEPLNTWLKRESGGAYKAIKR